MRYFAVVDVEAGAQMRIVGHGFAPALVGESEDEGQGGAVESKSGSARYGSGHVRDAIMNHIVDQVGGVGMSGGAASLETSALIDGHVDEDGAGFHSLDHRGGHQLRRGGAGHQHAS